MMRLTWLQPEDLLPHEFRQAEEEGRDVSSVRARWLAAGGCPCPPPSGASPHRASPELRALAESLLTELEGLTDEAERHFEPVRRLRTRREAPISGVQGRQPLVAGRGGTGESPAGPTHPARLHAAWLGRAAGCLLGKPVEKLPLKAIRALAKSTGNWPLHTWFTARGVPPGLRDTYPWNKRSARTSLAENINGMPEDDDLNYPLLNLLLLQRHGKKFTTHDVATTWLEELPAARTFTAERVAYRNLLNGIPPPRTARHHNPFREWIGALIRADVHGWTNPGDPAAAAEQAYRDACLTHTANGVYGAMFAAATIARAASGTADVHESLAAGLTVVPEDSRLARAVRHGIQLAETHRDFDDVVDQLHATYGTYHWVHVVPNAALLAAALTHADGDFTASITRAVSGGWDTDSNGATAGSVAGLLSGDPNALPERWTAPLRNRLATSVGGFHGTGFDTLAALTARLTTEPAPQTGEPAPQTGEPTPQEAPRP